MRASLLVGLFLCLFSCSSTPFQAEPPVARGPASATLPEDTLSIANALQPYVKKIRQPVFTYHYVTRELLDVPTTGPLDLTDSKLANHVQDWSSYFMDLSQPGGTGMIRGFYLATDPVVSRDFGKDHWLLYRVVLTAGLTYLDVKALESASEYIPQPIQDQLKAKGCQEQKWSYLIYKSFDPACRAIAIKTLRDLDVALIDYPWMSADFPPCTHRPSDAFILLRSDRLDSDASQIMYSEMSRDDLTIMKRQEVMERLFSEVKPNAAQSGSTSPETSPDKYRLWPDVDTKSVTDTDFVLYLRGHIYGCETTSLSN